MSVLRVVSYNIHKGRSATGARESLSQLRLGLYGLRPDLLFLQEVQGRNHRQSVLDAQHESLGAALGMDVCYGRNAVRTHTDHGNALLSRFEVLSYENEDVSDHRLEQRGLLHAVVSINNTDVHCIVVHLGLFAGGRSRQVLALVERIRRLVPADAPLLIAGDFNDWNNRLAPLFVKQLSLYEVFSVAPHAPHPGPLTIPAPLKALGQSLRVLGGNGGFGGRPRELGVDGMARTTPPPRTFPAVFPWFRLDRIYQRGFAVRTARVLHGKPWSQWSDHAPIFTELELP
ncbi:endonuclease/exonuclease/phosphatase family protein [Pusillimonas minor]|uniref:Endonuclease/exonuclease/phosphatase family protein n=1 Tax=Pusillimonas minor TaxID=2697024 RepID=A0A842HL30_9BURK|nr:endonuclease/exonuclease/phosphatase family protein [Pusillimonas minor]MBC2768986.1 endonuclease/exonuclease/phosphatase family protein [Pusillimonas minor]